MILKILNILKVRIRRIIQKWSSSINRAKFRSSNIQFGKEMNVIGKVYLDVHEESTVTIGDNFTFLSGMGLNPLCRNLRGSIRVRRNAILRIGNRVGMSSACIWVKKQIEIGNNVFIGGNVIMMDNDAHTLNWQIRRSDEMEDGLPVHASQAASAPIIIEDDVMIGANTIILKGTRIGARSVIGAGSVVTKSIPADCIAAGNPCRVIRQLTEKD